MKKIKVLIVEKDDPIANLERDIRMNHIVFHEQEDGRLEKIKDRFDTPFATKVEISIY